MKVACVFLVLVLCCVTLVSAQQQTIVETISTGPIAGYTQNGLNYFLGIPYAQPPIGSLRFAAPVPAQKWAQTINTQQYGTYLLLPLSPTPSKPAFISPMKKCLWLNKNLPTVKFSPSLIIDTVGRIQH